MTAPTPAPAPVTKPVVTAPAPAPVTDLPRATRDVLVPVASVTDSVVLPALDTPVSAVASPTSASGVGVPEAVGRIEQLVESLRSALHELTSKLAELLSEPGAIKALSPRLRELLVELRLRLAELAELINKHPGALDRRLRTLLAELRAQLGTVDLAGPIDALKVAGGGNREIESLLAELRRLQSVSAQVELAGRGTAAQLAGGVWAPPPSLTSEAPPVAGVQQAHIEAGAIVATAAPAPAGRGSHDGGGVQTTGPTGPSGAAAPLQSPVSGGALVLLVAVALAIPLFFMRLSPAVTRRLPLLLAPRLERPG